MSHRLQITLDDDLYVALKAEAERTGAALAEVVRRSVEDRLGRPMSDADKIDALRRASGIWADRVGTGTDIQAEWRRPLHQRMAEQR